MIKYYYDLKRSDCFIYEKSQGTIIKLSNYTQSTKLTKKEIVFILQSELVNVSTLSSIKYYDEQDQGFLEVNELKPIDLNQIQDDFLIILLRTKDESGEFYKSNIKHITTIVSNLKIDISANYHSLFGRLFQNPKATIVNKNTQCDEEFIYLYSDPLVYLESKEMMCNDRNPYYKKDIEIINERVKNTKGRSIGWTYYVVIPEVLFEIITKKPKMIFLSCNGVYNNNKYLIEVENKKGEKILFDLDELDSLKFNNVQLLILSNCTKNFKIKFHQLGFTNIIFIHNRTLNDERQTKENDKLFLSTLYENLFNGNSIKKSFEAAVTTVITILQDIFRSFHKLSSLNTTQSAQMFKRTTTINHNSQLINNFQITEIKERYHLYSSNNTPHCNTSNDIDNSNENSKDSSVIVFDVNIQNQESNTVTQQLIAQKFTYGRNMELYTLFNSNQRITIIYSEREVGKDNFLTAYSNYLLERKLYSADMMIKIFIANRSITEHLIAKKISFKLKLSKWHNIKDFYSEIKNLKCVFFIKFFNESLKDKEEIERTLTNFITKTITPKVYVIMVLNEVVQEIKVNKFKLTKIKKRFVLYIIKERSLEYPFLYQALEDLVNQKIILRYINGILFKISQIIYFYSLSFVDEQTILSCIKDSTNSNNLFVSILLQIAQYENNEHYINNTSQYMFILFALSFIQEGLAIDHLKVYRCDLELDKMTKWIEQLIKHRFLSKNESSYLGEFIIKIHHSFTGHINTHLAPFYIKQWVKSSLVCISKFFIHIRHTLYLTKDFDILDEYSSVIPHSFWVSLNPKYSSQYSQVRPFKLDTDLEFVVREYEQMILLLFNTYREMIKEILTETINQGNDLYKETIEQISIDIVTYYKFEDNNECSYWINYFSDFLKEMNYKTAYQRLLLFAYTFNNDLVSLSTMLEILNANDNFMLLFNIYQLVQRTKNQSLSKESLMLIFEVAIGYFSNGLINDTYIKVLMSYFLMKLSLSSSDLNCVFKQFVLFDLMNDSSSEYFNSRIKIDYYTLIIKYYITIGNIYSASGMIRIIEDISINHMNHFSYQTIQFLKSKIASIRTGLDFNHIYFLHSNPLLKLNDNCGMYSSTKWYNKIRKLGKYNKEICYKYLTLNKSNLALILDEFPKILVIVCEDYDDNDFIIENDAIESVRLSQDELKEIINKSTSLASSIVVLAFPTSARFAQLFLDKDIKHVISFNYTINQVNEYQQKHPCLGIGKAIKSFTFYFIKKLIKGNSIEIAFHFSKRKMELKYEMYAKDNNNKLIIDLTNIKLQGEGNSSKPYQDDYEDSLLFNGDLIDISSSSTSSSNHSQCANLFLKTHNAIIGRLSELHQIISMITIKEINDPHCVLNVIGDASVGKSLFVKEIYNILLIKQMIKGDLMYMDMINENSIEKLTLMLDGLKNKMLIDSLVVFDLNYVDKDLIDIIKDFQRFNCKVIIVTKRSIPKVKLENVVPFELVKLHYDISKSSLKKCIINTKNHSHYNNYHHIQYNEDNHFNHNHINDNDNNLLHYKEKSKDILKMLFLSYSVYK